MVGASRLRTTAIAIGALALAAGHGARCEDCRPDPVPCPPCFVCIQTPIDGRAASIPSVPCPLPGRTA
jgi:hypothetical protein